MDAPAPGKAVRILSWLPYWAVFQEDIRQTLHSWVYRTWVLVCLCSALGYLLYHRALYHEAGIVQNASNLVSDDRNVHYISLSERVCRTLSKSCRNPH